jgi:hypothetical protein
LKPSEKYVVSTTNGTEATVVGKRFIFFK